LFTGYPPRSNEKMKTISTILLIASVLSLASCATSPMPEQTAQEESPHAEAIRLVMSTQQDIIRKVDPNNWWHDVKTREWRAKRPFLPGTIDSTHMFVVSYHIDGKAVHSWLVDTRTKQVQSEKIPDKIREE